MHSLAPRSAAERLLLEAPVSTSSLNEISSIVGELLLFSNSISRIRCYLSYVPLTKRSAEYHRLRSSLSHSLLNVQLLEKKLSDFVLLHTSE